MNNIRLFIISSSVLLTAWLTASYTAQLDGSESSLGQSSQSVTLSSQTSETPAVESKAQIHSASVDIDHASSTPPVARIK